MKHILGTLAFYVFCGKDVWHTYSKKDKSTKNAINCLVKRGYLKTNEFSQACWTGKTTETFS